MGSSNKTKCWRCGTEFSKKQGYCPSCDTISITRFRQAESFEQIVRIDPKVGLQCTRCGSLYPNKQDKCLICNARKEEGFTKSIAHMSKKDVENIRTPIKVAGSKLTKRKAQELSSRTRTAKPGLTICSACEGQISSRAESCPHCGNPTGIHVCPKCNGIDTEAISGASKAASVFLFGVFAANNVVSKFRCKSCGHKW